MNGKVAKMLRRMKANDKRSKTLWKTLTPAQKTTVRATYNVDGPEAAVVVLAALV